MNDTEIDTEIDTEPYLELRSPSRKIGWGFIVVGVVGGLLAFLFAEPGLQLTMIALGVMFVLPGANLVIASVRCDETGLRYRSLWPRSVPIAEIVAIDVVPVTNTEEPMSRIVVRRARGRAVKLGALDLGTSRSNDARLGEQADLMRVALRLSPSAV
jgi:hypothetical protein